MFCPKRQGFFPIIFQRVQDSLSPEEISQFASCITLEERIIFVWGLYRVESIFKEVLRPFYGEKNGKRSAEKREAGNAQFYAGNYRQAQIMYSVAVYCAKISSNEDFKINNDSNQNRDYSLALANRSACFQRTKQYNMALQDISLALEAGYPPEKSFKLHERKAECQEAVFNEKCLEPDPTFEDGKAAVIAYAEAIKTVSKSNLSKDKMAAFIKTTKEKMEIINRRIKTLLETKSAKNGNPVTSSVSNILIDPQTLTVEESHLNQAFPAASTAVKFHYQSHRGRFAVADQDIEVGTTILRESPITYALHPEKYGTNCQHCFANIRGVVPCPKCVWVCFCSTKCRDEAISTYHKYECAINKHVIESGLNVYAYLTLRAIANLGPNKLLSSSMRDQLSEGVRSEKKGVEEDKNCNSINVYHSKDFLNLYALMSHEETLNTEEWLLRTLIAIFLLKSLQLTGFFKSILPVKRKDIIEEEEEERMVNDVLAEEELFTCKVILRLINICPTNCHDVSEFETPVTDSFTTACNKVSLGAAIYPTLALFNHACDPSFMRCNKGNSVICVANRKIRKGEEICENYGLVYTTKSTQERRKVLMDHYKFECACLPCVDEWPDLMHLKTECSSDPQDKNMFRFYKIICSECHGTIRRRLLPTAAASQVINPDAPVTCLVCGHETNIQTEVRACISEIKAQSKMAIDYLVKGRWNAGIECVKSCDNLMNKHLSLPLLELAEAQIAIWKCMWLKYGNMKLVKMI